MTADESSSWFSGIGGLFKLGATALFSLVSFGGIDTSDEGLSKAFRAIDTDGGGSISRDELRAYAVSISKGQQLDNNALDAMMKAADTNGDNEVDLEEFKSFVRAAMKK